MLRYWRIWLLIICVMGAILAIGLKPPIRGVEITYISDISPVKDVLKQGMIITHVEGIKITSVDEWDIKTRNLTGLVSLVVNGKTYKFLVNETLGIDVMDVERTNLNFGLDLRGGTRIVLKPRENATTKDVIDQVIATLQTRANIYGLKEIKFYSIKGTDENYYVQIEAAGIKKDVVDDLLSKQGRFEAKISKPVDLVFNKGTIKLGVNNYPVVLKNDSIIINNSIIYPNQSFELDGIEFKYINKTANRLNFLATVYKGKDIELVYSDPQRSGVRPISNGFMFYFVVLVSDEGAERFAKVTTGIPRRLDLRTGEEYLDSKIYLYLDDNLVSELQIDAELGGKVYQSPQIQGTRLKMEDAIEEKLSLQTILRSGALPVTLEVSSVDIISPTLGKEFFNSAGFAAGFAGLIVFGIIFIRYRKLKVALPLVLIAFSEVVIILGIAAINDSMIWFTVLGISFLLILTSWWKKHEIDIYAWSGAILIPLLGMMSWTIDLPAIAGIIAVIGTGVDHQIVIADETLKGKRKERIYTLKENIKRAFFIIFGAAATTIAAMLPLMSIGIGLVRGFAITTIVGILVGVLITRPAYAKIIELTTK